MENRPKVKKEQLLILICIVNLLFCFLVTRITYAEQQDADTIAPEKVVSKFCHLDADGYRLSGDTMKKIWPLVLWPEEAGDRISIISEFKVSKAIIINSTAKVTVSYKYLGSTDFIDFAVAQKRYVDITYKLVKQKGSWKIKGPVTAPHVNWNVAIKHLMDIKKGEPARGKALDSIIQKIKDAENKM